MSRQLYPWNDLNNYFRLGSTVEFDGPDGGRLTGTIVRTSSNPDYLHVEVRGHRYEVSINGDNAEMVWGC